MLGFLSIIIQRASSTYLTGWCWRGVLWSDLTIPAPPKKVPELAVFNQCNLRFRLTSASRMALNPNWAHEAPPTVASLGNIWGFQFKQPWMRLVDQLQPLCGLLAPFTWSWRKAQLKRQRGDSMVLPLRSCKYLLFYWVARVTSMELRRTEQQSWPLLSRMTGYGPCMIRYES